MIYHKDVLEGFPDIENNTADIVLIDPPYNIGKDFGDSKDNMSLTKYIAWASEWLSEGARVLKNTGTMYVYGFPEILAHLAVDLPYPLEHRWLVWSYQNKAVPKLQFWQRSHESILCCWKHNSRIFNTDDVREAYTDVFLRNAAGKVRKGTKGRFSHEDKETIYNAHEAGALPRDVLKADCLDLDEAPYMICKRQEDGTYKPLAPVDTDTAIKFSLLPKDVIKVPALAGGAGAAERWFLCKTCDSVHHNKAMDEHKGHEIIQHPTQKPYELTKRLLVAAKPKEGGLVVIPFVGTGSECAVAEDLGMKYVGFEINEDYVKLANGFLENR